MTLTYGSLFSGIGGLDRGMDLAGFECKWQVEFNKQAQDVLTRHWPKVPKFGDISKVKGKDLGKVDVIVGGFPCQDLSVAGKRAGLAGQRSGLFHEFMRIVDEVSPTWIVAENVPGILSSGCKPACEGGCVATHGGAMGTVIGEMAQRGYMGAWRVLDAAYFGLAQRRRRVFIVAGLGVAPSWPAEVLLEPSCLHRDPPKVKQAGKKAASTAAASARACGQREVVAALTATGVGTCGADDNQAQAGHLVVQAPADPISKTLVAPIHGPRFDYDTETFVYSIYPETGQGTDIRAVPVDKAPTLTAVGESAKTDRGTRIVTVESFAENQRGELRTSPISTQLTTGGGKPGQGYAAVRVGATVRRLTPKECERLQGFPDDHTLHGAKDNIIKDSARYRMLGNAVAVPVAQWVATRLHAVAEREKNGSTEANT